jgi:hypothetical protein
MRSAIAVAVDKAAVLLGCPTSVAVAPAGGPSTVGLSMAALRRAIGGDLDAAGE